MSKRLPVVQIHALADNAVEFHLASNELVPACSEQCSWCCYQPVPVWREEFVQIASIIRRMNIATLHEIRAAIAPAVRADNAMQGVSSRWPHAPCPLLGGDKRCMVYAERPLACRSHVSISEPACRPGASYNAHAVVESARLFSIGAVHEYIDTDFRLLSEALAAFFRGESWSETPKIVIDRSAASRV